MREASLHLYLDSADLGELRAVLPHPLIYGVTTNPTLMRRARLPRRELPSFVETVLDWGVEAIQVQVESSERESILLDARAAKALAPGRIIPKIPATREGFAAGARLSSERVPVTYTAVYEPEQAVFAAISGAAYVAPYLGRLTDRGDDALARVAAMQALVTRYGPSTRLLVASVRTREAFLSLLDLGVGAITVAPRLVPELLDHAATLEAERDFLADAAALGSAPVEAVDPSR